MIVGWGYRRSTGRNAPVGVQEAKANEQSALASRKSIYSRLRERTLCSHICKESADLVGVGERSPAVGVKPEESLKS